MYKYLIKIFDILKNKYIYYLLFLIVYFYQFNFVYIMVVIE